MGDDRKISIGESAKKMSDLSKGFEVDDILRVL
jgi:hypothetical protein